MASTALSKYEMAARAPSKSLIVSGSNPVNMSTLPRLIAFVSPVNHILIDLFWVVLMWAIDNLPISY